MQQTAISIRNLVKFYEKKGKGRLLAIDDLDLTVPSGSIFGLLGSNGAGKSTLINILSGTVVKTSGEIKIDGVNIDDYPKKARSLIGVVPQEIVFDTFFPIAQSLEFVAGYFGIRPNLRKTEEILKALSLWDKRDILPSKLSGGMKRRFLIAKAMVHSPKVLILDEPTAGVDIELREQLWSYLKKLNKQGVTIIITTHYLAEAQELCNEIAFINKGKILKQDSKQNILKEFGDRHIDIEFKNHVQLSDFDFPQNIMVKVISSNILRFQLENTGNNYSMLLQKITNTGKEIQDIRSSQIDLENIFRKIIKI